MNPNRPPQHQGAQMSGTVGIVPRCDIQATIMKTVAKVSELRSQMLMQAAELFQMHGMAEAAQLQLRAATLGQLPGGLDKVLPTNADLAALATLSRRCGELAEAMNEVSKLNPMDREE